MIGEIRDAETATTALQAALTGHRLLSSMHTQTPAEALIRMQQMARRRMSSVRPSRVC